MSFIAWDDKPGVVMGTTIYVLSRHGSSWIPVTLDALDCLEVIGEAEFRLRFADWNLPPLPAEDTQKLAVGSAAITS
ncbi:hypothetical protein SLNSH_02805 [Alsobacter soli]|uniref:Uncharacterized protein n=1 Tax=Alsobacter soli TaxID=2109933 RepID=A0A2T1HYH3_9HYPH|nr:hypothetical protein [Alsobacter soli]PSC06743.1 hypothetical protein SLNSH_02805 [Alsobacter soli]